MTPTVPDHRAIAAQVLAESPPLDDFPTRGLRPKRGGTSRIVRAAGWPHQLVPAEITQPESVDGSGWHRPARTQTVDILIVPGPWLRRYAELLGVRLGEVCDGKYSEDE